MDSNVNSFRTLSILLPSYRYSHLSAVPMRLRPGAPRHSRRTAQPSTVLLHPDVASESTQNRTLGASRGSGFGLRTAQNCTEHWYPAIPSLRRFQPLMLQFPGVRLWLYSSQIFRPYNAMQCNFGFRDIIDSVAVFEPGINLIDKS
jgi:hypothetical protein